MKDQNLGRLEQTTKAVAMSIYEKLLLLESELRVHSKALQNNPKRSSLLTEGPQHFINITHFRDAEAEFIDKSSGIPITGLSNSLREWLNEDMSILLTQPISRNLSEIHLASIMFDKKGVVIGEINPAYLFGIGEINTLPPMTELAVFNRKGETLVSSLDAIEPIAEKLRERTSGDQLPRF
ncbi:MAG: hypothetical protein U9Q05_01435, partial [Thermodesulfobacteriota bacterium]|nr:hypothetical protein [Thermodesulfobacteriota bacterium]